MNTSEQLELVDYNIAEIRVLTSRAKHLGYPITDITSPIISLARDCGLEEEMEVYLEDVRKAQGKLESAIFKCEDAFTDKKSELECRLEETEEN